VYFFDLLGWFKNQQGECPVKKILWLGLAMLLLLAGCSDMEQAAKAAGKDPSQLLYLYAIVNCAIAFLLAMLSGWGIFLSIIQSIRISGALCVIVTPILLTTYDSYKPVIGIGLTGCLGVIIVTAIFWKDLYPQKRTRAQPAPAERFGD